MTEPSDSTDAISFSERVATAIVSAFAATLTLALYPIAVLLLGYGAGGAGGGGFEIGAMFYAFVFSKVGVAVVIGAALLGFCLGSERMASVFGFFWGTHSIWARLGAYLDDKTSVLSAEHNVPVWVLGVVLVILVCVIVAKYA